MCWLVCGFVYYEYIYKFINKIYMDFKNNMIIIRKIMFLYGDLYIDIKRVFDKYYLKYMVFIF